MTLTHTSQEVALEDLLIEKTVGALELFSIHLGRELGLYRWLSTPQTPDQLAETAGIDQRYAREWLEQQAVSGLVQVDNPEADPIRRVYWLSDTNREVLIDPESPVQVGPLADLVAGAGLVVDRVADAYRTGDGVPYEDYGRVFRDGQAAINRPAFKHDLVPVWIGESVPEIYQRLEHGGRVADLGCGAGWSTIALATGFPEAMVIGYDSDAASIDDARVISGAAGVGAQFRAANGAAILEDGPFDLAVLVEALHDMANPVEVLTNTRKALQPDGALVVADELVADEFAPRGDVLERMMYGWSVIHCLPASMAEKDSAAIGTVLRRGLVEQMALSAGFGSVETPDVDGGFFRIYVLRP